MSEKSLESKFFNRELSWLQFNSRVLGLSKNTKIPLLERLKFLAIYASNLDEFYMVRVAGLNRLYVAGISESGPDMLSPLEQLNNIRIHVHKEQEEVESTYLEVLKLLEGKGIVIKSLRDLDIRLKEGLKEHFLNYIYPIIVPIIVDSTHPFPHLNNLSFGMVLKLKDRKHPFKTRYGIVRIPRMLSRFIDYDGMYVTIESVVGEFIGEVFQGLEVLSYSSFRITRNADMDIEEEEADDFIELMSEGLKARKRGEIVRLEIENVADKDILNFLIAHTKIQNEDIYKYNIPLNLGTLWEIINNKNYSSLRYKSFSPKITFGKPLSSDNIFNYIDSDDRLLYQPYESFDPVLYFIKAATKDKDVYSIRMTLYRVGSNSPIVKALTEAAENNKQVTVLVELRARFDEETNLYWAKALERAGAHVIYGIPGLKVHAKIALVIKKIGHQFKKYVHIASGNYNPITAKLYTDISYFTAKESVAQDALRFFHALSTGHINDLSLDYMYIAPTQMKKKLLEMIHIEGGGGKQEKDIDGEIILKANSLVDRDIIEALYLASDRGVKIDLIIRGICCLKPRKNIRVISIVGKYLEHARIYYFKHSGIYFSSADLMPRNLERRVEILMPVRHLILQNKLKEILDMQLEDNVGARLLNEDGSYSAVEIKPKEKAFNSQFKYEEKINALKVHP